VRPKLRFLILQRDNFACRYCGARAPTARLEIDHIHPRSEGGKDTWENLVVACKTCNLGKKARLFPDAVLRAVQASIPARRRRSSQTITIRTLLAEETLREWPHMPDSWRAEFEAAL
jgi:5-methylcytosine-specific restriction endonuclease McrA